MRFAVSFKAQAVTAIPSKTLRQKTSRSPPKGACPGPRSGRERAHADLLREAVLSACAAAWGRGRPRRGEPVGRPGDEGSSPPAGRAQSPPGLCPVRLRGRPGPAAAARPANAGVRAETRAVACLKVAGPSGGRSGRSAPSRGRRAAARSRLRRVVTRGQGGTRGPRALPGKERRDWHPQPAAWGGVGDPKQRAYPRPRPPAAPPRPGSAPVGRLAGVQLASVESPRLVSAGGEFRQGQTPPSPPCRGRPVAFPARGAAGNAQ